MGCCGIKQINNEDVCIQPPKQSYEDCMKVLHRRIELREIADFIKAVESDKLAKMFILLGAFAPITVVLYVVGGILGVSGSFFAYYFAGLGVFAVYMMYRLMTAIKPELNREETVKRYGYRLSEYVKYYKKNMAQFNDYK